MRSLKTILAAGLIASLPTLAHAQWYVGLDAGASLLEKSKVTGSGLDYSTSHDLGPVVLGQGGYAFGPLKIEGELGYRNNGSDKVGSQTGGGGITAISPMVNAIYEFLPDSRWHPFVGAGIGAAYLDSGSISRSGTKVYGGNDWGFAYQGFTGVSFDVDKNWGLKAQYRYFATTDTNVSASPGNQSLSQEYRDHAVLVGFTYKFGAPAPAPVPVAAPAAAPAPMPAPAPVKQVQEVQKNYIVFFDFDKAVITPEAAQIIQQAVAAAKSRGAASIALTGHTDKAGADKYNMALSLKRANAVKEQLVRLGMPADQVAVVAKGKSQPLVATPDGMREPQNRRVEIVLP